MEARLQKAKVLVQDSKVTPRPGGYAVRSQTGSAIYLVTLDGMFPSCTCEDFELTSEPCKHILAARIFEAQQARIVKGIVFDEELRSLVGVTVRNRNNGKGTVTDSKGGYAIPADAGDVLIVWSELGGQTSPRVLTTVRDDVGNDVTPPVAPTGLSVSALSTDTFLVTGRGEINGTAHVTNLTRVVPDGQGSLTWNAGDTQTLASFAVVISAQRGDQLRVWISDPSLNTGTEATIAVP